MNADEVLEGLDPEQRAVAATPLGPMVVLAGAGTGKTRAITHRIAYGVHSAAYQPQRVLAVTFTARAAGEMRTRLRSLGVPQVQARTFHAAALRQLHYFWPRAIGGAAPEVLPHKAPVVGEAASRLRLQLDRVVMRDLASEIEWSKVSMLTSETYPAAARRAGRSPAELDPTAMARLIELYEEVKTERGVIDFEDVLLLMVGILAEHPEIAREVRAQYRHFVVDEYQDVNTLQQHLLDQWVGERDDLCVVGDPAQTIYSFTGASPRHLLDFGQRHPSAQQVRLVRNYRSTPQVIGLANLVLAGSGRDAVQLQAQRAGGPAPELTAYPDDQAEARGVASELRRLVDTGESPAEMAILFRTNGQSEALEAALTELEVPYLVRGGERFFNRAEVRNAVLLLRAAARSDDGSTPLGDLVRDVITGAGWSVEPPAGGAQRERWESLNALATLADDFAAAGEDVRLPHLVAELDRRAGSSTRRPCRASRSPRCTRPRVWSGTPSSSWAPPTGCCRSRWPPVRRRSRRSGACSTSASPGRAGGWGSPSPRPGLPVAARPAARRGSSTARRACWASRRARAPRPSRCASGGWPGRPSAPAAAAT
ncbi:hypothetical protein GCM10025872_07990 [Barrientosiimonas endolithica]|uniref:DNA 3'-5' helicase n=1 Tax=Barrientosiimonas endolithica TaxID=1535208 RepID=A0ABN6YI34_9MICO|nr:hypothetical protein GCM10025872_07990 [Barrientosiimonas endolithica]